MSYTGASGSGRVGDVRVASSQREAPGHRGAAGLEHRGPREFPTVAVAVEISGHHDALGMVLPKSGMDAERVGEPVDERLTRQIPAGKPVVDVRDGAEIDGQEDADGTETHENRATGRLVHDLINESTGRTVRLSICHSCNSPVLS